MLVWSAWVLTAAVILGLILIILSQTVQPGRQPWWPGAVHGALGIAGFGLLLAGLGGPPRGVQEGAGSFGTIAAWFTVVTLCLGGWLAADRIRRRPPTMLVIGVHATIGVGALVMLAAYVAS